MSDFAPLYSVRERIQLVAKALAICVPIYLLSQFWFLPWLRDYAEHANCYFYGDITGVHLVWYGVFVFIPLSSAGLVAALTGPRSLRVWRLGQDPLPGEKTLRKTRYRYGQAARLPMLLLWSIILFFVGMSIWGVFQAEKLTRSIAPCEQSTGDAN